MAKIKKSDFVLLMHSGRNVLVRAEERKFQSDWGILELKKLIGKSFDSSVETSAGKKVTLAKPQFYDILQRCRRGPAVILPKDFAAIVALTGVGAQSEIVDIGTGSGWLAAQMANICKKVTTYEIRKDFYQLAKRNFEFLGLKNISAKNVDASEGVAERDVDLFTVDVQEPQCLLEIAAKSLRAGGHFVAYCPQITQVIRIANKLETKENSKNFLGQEKLPRNFSLDSKLKLEKVLEVLQRDWKVDGVVARPEHQMLGHTGFIVVARKI